MLYADLGDNVPRRRSKRWNDIFDQEEEEKQERRPRMSLDGEDDVPRPYHYGLVGHSASPTPPNSPPMGPMSGAHSPSNSLSLLNAAPNHHSRSSSGVNLPSPGSMSRSLSDLGYAPPTPNAGHVRPNLSTSSSAAASTRPLLERPVNHSRPPSSWSTGGQSAGPGTELTTGRLPSTPISPRPHSAGGNMQQTAQAAATAAAANLAPSPHSSPMNEKRRLRASLPQGAAAPTPPSTVAAGPASPPAVQSPRSETRAPVLSPRNPNRPKSAKGGPVVVHVDGGPARPPDDRPPGDGNEPPAYSPN